jgi:hypothetical protein
MCVKNNNGVWIKGLTWTPFQLTTTTNPDGSVQASKVHAGLFLWFTMSLWEGRYIEVYAGFRPTPVWSSGYGNEGILTSISQWLKKKGLGNLGFALRLKRSGAWKIS